MNICMVSRDAVPTLTGQYIYTYYLSKMLSSFGHSVHHIIPGLLLTNPAYYCEMLPRHEGRCTLVSTSRENIIKDVADTIKHLNTQERFHILHAHLCSYPLMACYFFKIRTPDARLVVTIHGDDTLIFDQPSTHIALKACNHIIVVDKNIIPLLKRHCTCRISFIPPGVDLSMFQYRQLQTKEFCILFVGRLCEEKGIFDLITAVELLKSRLNHFRLLFVGSGPAAHQLQDAIHSKNLHHCVSVIPAVPYSSMPDIYHSASVLVLPSYIEGTPLCVLEAMACGRPIVCTSVGNLPDIVKDGINGLLFQKGDATAMAEALLQLALDSELAETMGRASRIYIEKEYIWEKTAEKHITIYEQLLEEFP